MLETGDRESYHCYCEVKHNRVKTDLAWRRDRETQEDAVVVWRGRKEGDGVAMW